MPKERSPRERGGLPPRPSESKLKMAKELIAMFRKLEQDNLIKEETRLKRDEAKPKAYEIEKKALPLGLLASADSQTEIPLQIPLQKSDPISSRNLPRKGKKPVSKFDILNKSNENQPIKLKIEASDPTIKPLHSSVKDHTLKDEERKIALPSGFMEKLKTRIAKPDESEKPFVLSAPEPKKTSAKEEAKVNKAQPSPKPLKITAK